ncbi:MAG: hypothetical protein OQK48_04015 [Sulfurimonas sp.]|uniref:hypothetical protein n=1 Tax=Sulfurimonas sp. TaxID=2022749 RepID=UPI0026168287|nr:hypothetical protein [Sulfurimonas sp.]MCW8894469.1 hypothetical protein [Sulfurimonas sp.]MCW8954085.1 hypothetical protein [Sulfurimonas sp.]MCW9068167.1 hypothetical protein [Sulfurimonas sp.]
MKFTLINNLQKDSAMSLVLKGFLVFILLYLVSDVVVMNSNFGISADKVNTTLFGNEEEYIDPISEASFLEFWHTEIFFIMMILLTLSAIFIRVAKRSRIILTNILMISSISSLIFLPLAYYMSNFFVHLYIFTYFIWHIMALYMILYSFWKLNAKSV